MKTSLPVALAVLAASLIPELRADLFQEPIQITSEGSPLLVESPGYATPCLADVDGDGIKDLLVGQFRDGKISLYRGRKSGATDFGPATWVTANGNPVKVPGVWWCTSSTPQFVDMDGDGTKDILSGCYSNHKPMAGLLYVLKGSASGFQEPKELKGTDGKPLIVHPDLKGTNDPRLTGKIIPSSRTP